MSDFYILDGHTPVKTRSVIEWGRWYNNDDARRVALADWGNGVRVSTVFLGLDHGYGIGPPTLFETMVFAPGTPLDEDCERCATWDEALAIHRKVVAEVASVLGPPRESEER